MTDTFASTAESVSSVKDRKPRLGFLGVGWIGLSRMEAIARSGLGEITAVCDTSDQVLERSLSLAPEASTTRSFDELLETDLDGVVIATPSAQHSGQSIRALEQGLAVFCQKPLACTAAETRRIIEAARHADRLLAVDLSYRFTSAMQAVRSLVTSGELGEIYAANLVFHNAYGPDKAWVHDRALSGGGCVIDLGIHLIDAALWILGFRNINKVSSRLYAKGKRLLSADRQVEDYANAQIDLANGIALDIACSWWLPAGQDCVIVAEFYGTRGGACFRNLNGSFYDFVAERYEGTRRQVLAAPPDPWPGRAAVDWVKRLQAGEEFDPANQEFIHVAEVLDALYIF
jgi:predicted dehydrogenase